MQRIYQRGREGRFFREKRRDDVMKSEMRTLEVQHRIFDRSNALDTPIQPDGPPSTRGLWAFLRRHYNRLHKFTMI